MHMKMQTANLLSFRWLTFAAMRLTLALALGATACMSGALRDDSLAATSADNRQGEKDTLAVSKEPLGDWWKPPLDTSWQWHLSELPIDPSFDVAMYDIDLFDNSAEVVRDLHAQGRKVVCYMSVGSWEEWRPDSDQFPPEVIGNDYEDWPGEQWLDIRQIDLLAPILRARLDLCKSKGFDAVEPDNMDSYTNDTGFPLTDEDQIKFNRWLATEAHARGLSIGLKNDPDQVADLVEDFDWALTEDCFDQGWCTEMLPFIEAGKPVFAAEYTDTGITLDDLCTKASELRFNVILKQRDLDAWRQACPEVISKRVFLPGIVKDIANSR